jgi:hypothetical protein
VSEPACEIRMLYLRLPNTQVGCLKFVSQIHGTEYYDSALLLEIRMSPFLLATVRVNTVLLNRSVIVLMISDLDAAQFLNLSISKRGRLKNMRN